MNLTIKKSPTLSPNSEGKNFGDLFSGTILFEEDYSRNTSILSGILTTSYRSDYLNILCSQAFQSYQFTDFQKETFTSFFDVFEEISRIIHPSELNIKIIQSKIMRFVFIANQKREFQ
jgi:hypothetical protein